MTPLTRDERVETCGQLSSEGGPASSRVSRPARPRGSRGRAEELLRCRTLPPTDISSRRPPPSTKASACPSSCTASRRTSSCLPSVSLCPPELAGLGPPRGQLGPGPRSPSLSPLYAPAPDRVLNRLIPRPTLLARREGRHRHLLPRDQAARRLQHPAGRTGPLCRRPPPQPGLSDRARLSLSRRRVGSTGLTAPRPGGLQFLDPLLIASEVYRETGRKTANIIAAKVGPMVELSRSCPFKPRSTAFAASGGIADPSYRHAFRASSASLSAPPPGRSSRVRLLAASICCDASTSLTSAPFSSPHPRADPSSSPSRRRTVGRPCLCWRRQDHDRREQPAHRPGDRHKVPQAAHAARDRPVWQSARIRFCDRRRGHQRHRGPVRLSGTCRPLQLPSSSPP